MRKLVSILLAAMMLLSTVPALADTLLERYPVLRLHAGEASFTLPSLEDAWQTLLIDDLQYMQEEQDWQALCAQIRESTWRRFSSAAQNT